MPKRNKSKSKNIVVVIPTCRSAPIKTLVEHQTKYPVVVLVDRKSSRGKIQKWVDQIWGNKNNKPKVVWGKRGPGPQSAECYRVAHELGYEYFFRFDDDIQKNFFVNMSKEFTPLDTAIDLVYEAAKELGTSLTGFSNTSRTDWLCDSIGVTYGQIHGGAQLGRAMEDPSLVVDESMPAYVDVWRTLAHRRLDGAVGRVKSIGLDRTESLRGSSILKTPELVEECKSRILEEFPGMVRCDKVKEHDGGRQVVPNWQMRPDPGYYQKRKEVKCDT